MAIDNYITTNEAAEILDVTAEAVRRHARNGRFGALKRGGIWWLEHEAILEYKRRTAGQDRYDPTKREGAESVK
jgi:excisionase family DNA binding protein